MQIFYRFIYNGFINSLLRGVNRLCADWLPFKLHPSGKINVKLKSGTEFKLHINQTSHVARQIYYYGPDAFEYTSLFDRLAPKCNSFFDIGANIGYYSFLAERCGVKDVYSFEPSPDAIFYLQKNAELNESKNIRIFQLALSNSNESISFHKVKSLKYKYLKHNLGGVSGVNPIGKESERITVQSITLDDFVNKNMIGQLDLIKIDTEGTEDKILQGAAHTIANHRPIIICETLYKKIETEIATEIQKHNYLMYKFLKGGLYATQTLARVQDDGVRDCFFVPPEKKDLLNEFIHG